MSSTHQPHSNTVTSRRYPHGISVGILFLGHVMEGGKIRPMYGPYVIMNQGYTVDGPEGTHEDAPCWVWCGNYRDGEPIMRTLYSSYFPRALMAKRLVSSTRKGNSEEPRS